MSQQDQFDWVPFYKELAGKLLPYKSDHGALIEKIKQIYATTGISFPTLERDNRIVDIDPFTFFGLFNKKITDANRISILKVIAELFSISAPVPHSFGSLPVLNPQNATFYPFLPSRKDTDMDALWNLFEAALKYAADPSEQNTKAVSGWFDIAVNIKYNGNSKITMGLYWIAPETFLNLDQRNTWYIYESKKIPTDVVDLLPKVEPRIPSATYFEIVKIIRKYLQSGRSSLKDFKELSNEAWRYSEEVNQQLKQQEKKEQQISIGEAIGDSGVQAKRYWMYAPGHNACKWDEFYSAGIMAIGWPEIGDLSQFNSKQDMKKRMKETIDPGVPYTNAAHATWQFAKEMKPGDIVYAKRGGHQLIGRGIVLSDYAYDASRQDGYPNVRKVKWTHNGEWQHPGRAVMKTLTDVTPYTEYISKLEKLFEEDATDSQDAQEPTADYPLYDEEQFLDEVFMDREAYQTLVSLVKTKKNVILQGAPGVGKTFIAKRLAYSMMGVKDQDRVMMIQFHQSYSYEDFIMGFRPSENGFELRHGAFYDFCKQAEIDSDNDYFFIIDEINRGNISRIFGELFMLIEADKRGIALQLLYSDEKFSIPENVYIIGMMNTADRSLAMLDYALRRRFGFFEIKPGFETEGFMEYRTDLNNEKFNKLIGCVESLNQAITSDESLGDGFCIGHSFFCNLQEVSDEALKRIVEFELIPLLKEYWFDDAVKMKDWAARLRSAIK